LLRKKYSEADLGIDRLLQAQPKDADLHHSLGSPFWINASFRGTSRIRDGGESEADFGEAYWT